MAAPVPDPAPLKRKHPDDDSPPPAPADALSLPSLPSDDSLLSEYDTASPPDAALLDDEDRRLKHKDAEKRRRVAINRSMSVLESLLPHGQGRKCSKAAVLTRTIEYIRSMRTLNRNLLEENRALQVELARVKLDAPGARPAPSAVNALPAGLGLAGAQSGLGLFRGMGVQVQMPPAAQLMGGYYEQPPQQPQVSHQVAQQQQPRVQMMYGGMVYPVWGQEEEHGKAYAGRFGIAGMAIPGSGLTQ